MTIEKLARKLEPLMPENIARWMHIRDIADPETKALIEKQIISTAYRVLGDVRKKILLSLPPEKRSSGAIRLGNVVYVKDRWSFGITQKELLQGLTILGRSGAGKTNVAFLVLEQLARDHVPFLFLDVKRTARHLLPLIRAKVNVYTPGRSLAPFVFNPFLVPPGMEQGVYLNQVVDNLAAAYTLGDGARSILQRALVACYEKNAAPNLQEIILEVENQPAQGRSQGWKMSALRALHSLRFANLGKVDRQSQEQLAHLLLHESTIIELDALGSSEKKFLIPLLCSWLYAVKLNSSVREKLSLAIFFEEAHHYLYRGERRTKESSMNTFLRQCRELGIACVVIDQHPHLLSSAALGLYTSICLNLKDLPDMNRAAALSLLDEEDKRIFSRLSVGYGVVKLQDRWTQPVLVRFPLMAVSKGSVTDVALNRYLHRKSTGTVRMGGQGLEFARVSRVLAEDEPLNHDELAFLDDIIHHPDDGVKARYLRLGMSIGRANAMKLDLIRRGWLEALVVPHGRTRKLLLRLSKQGKEALGIDTPKGHHQSLAHEYWKRFYARRFEGLGYHVQEEAPFGDGRADVLATKKRKVIAIEIETGMSDTVANVKRDLRAGCTKVIVIATDDRAMRSLETDLAQAGLLIQSRLELVSAAKTTLLE